MSNSASDDWQAVRSLFEACVDAPTAQRAALLTAAAGNVRTEVEELLREHDTSTGQLDPEDCHQALVSAATDFVDLGSDVGGFRIVQVLGRGGMGTVYLAEQETPRRRVALKLLSAAVVGKDATQRFQLEAELLSRLRHQGIAQIYEVGVHEETTPLGTMHWPFFAMEYVEKATTLSAWIAERQRSEREVLDVGLQICAAVQHAHERGVVHRDLKPQNVLIDGNGNPRVIDFGIARSAEHDSGLTQTGELLGTLRYMAPEQVRGDSLAIDTRTDVHALGVLLFEMLTQQRPFDFDGKSLPEVGKILTEQTARPLRQVRPDANADLELILATAMAKDPDRRYAQAGSLADDLQRYLRREAIDARPPSLRYQLGMFARRRRGLVAAITALFLVSTIGGATSLVYAVRAQRAEQRAVRESDQKLQAMRRVFDNAMRSVIGLPRRLTGVPGTTKLRREIIEDAVEQLQFVEDNVSLDQGMRYSLAVAYRDLGAIRGVRFLGHEGDRAQAKQSLERARDYIDEFLLSATENVDALLLRFDIEVERGELAFAQQRTSPAVAEHWSKVEELIARIATLVPDDDPRLLDAKAVHEQHVGDLSMMERDQEQALVHFTKARDLRIASLQGEPPGEDMRMRLAMLYRSIAIAEQARRHGAAALQAFAKAVEALSFVEQQPQQRQQRGLYAMIRSHYGYSLASQGEYDAGEQHLRWAQQELARLYESDDSNAALAASLGMACQRLADHLAISAKYAEAATGKRALYEEAKALAERGVAIGEPLVEQARDMVNIFMVAECKRIRNLCERALR